MTEHFLGPMDPIKFMDAFMPVNPSGVRHRRGKINFGKVCNVKAEKSMYNPFVSHPPVP